MSLPAKTMDERKLTAWLIMEGYLTPSQVKQALEEQLRLKRDGTEIDIIEVARREKIISDVQVLEVLEKTGYKPPKPASAGSSAERPSLQDPAAAKVTTPKKPSSDSGWGKAATGAPGASDDRIDSVPMIPAQYAESVAEIPSEYAVYARGAAGSEATSDASVSDLSSVAGSETPSAEVPAVASDEATPLAGGAPPSTKRSSGTHRAGRTSGARGSAATLQAAARRRSNDSTKNLLVAGAFLIPIIIALLFMGPRRSTTDVSKVDTPTKRVQTDNDFQAVVADLNASLDRMESAPGKAGRDAEVKRLKGVLARLKAAKLVVSERRLVDKAEDRLKRLTGEARIGGGDDIPLPPPLSPEELKVRAESAWANLARNFERILWLSIQQPRGELQLGAESIRNVDLKKKVTKAIPSYSAKGPDGIAALVGAPELHPILGVGGYSALLREASRFPDELRGTDRWKRWGKAIIPQFEKLQGLAEAYRDAMRAAEEHSDVGDLQAALACFEHPKHRTDTWFVAVRKYLALPAVVKEFEERKKAAAAGTPITRRRRLPSSRNGGTTSNWRRNWQERFLHLAKQHQRAKTDDEKASLAGDLDKILTETLDMARSSWESCKRVVAFYDTPKHAKVFKRAPQLKPNLKAHHELYFKGAFARASGPESFRSLDRWCKLHGYEAWRAQIAPYLRLVAAANNRAARAREGVRQRRAGAKAAVAKFDRTRLKNVREGLVQVVEWMRKRGYGPDPVKKELDDLIARAVERAGDPIAGARLRGDVAAVAHTVKEADAAKTAKAFKKQLDGVIKEAVDRSLVAVTKCIQAGEPGLAFDLFKYVLLIDPDNERAHKGLGHVQVSFKGAKTWMRRFDANRLKAGYRWDKTLGWVRYKDQKRYDAGEYYDLQRNQWTTVAEANQHHSDPSNFWIIKTEHFELRTSADIAVATRVCERLEAFYLQLFRQYDKFFLGKGAQSTKLIFGMSPSQKAPLVVHFYRSRAQFTQHANPPTDWAAGFYSGGRKASFFYQSGGWTTLQHEIVHQILGETARGGGGAPAWLAEGAAVYLEDAFFKDGSLTLGARENHRRVMTYQYNERSGGQEHKLLDMLKFVTSADWDSGDIAKNYRGAGSVVYFLCHFDNGRYKGDFIEYLKAAYYGGRPKLSDYFGLPESILNDLMRRFYDPKAKLTGGGPASAADLAVAVEAFTKSCKSKTPDLDQLSEAFGLLTKALGGSTSKEAEKTRKKAGKALIAMRTKLAKKIEKEIKGAVSNKGLGARRAKLERLRQKAIAIIEDTTAYPDANHGAAGQHLVDKEVNELKAFWNQLPPVFEKPELKPVIEVLEGTAAWLEVLARDIKKRGKTMAELKDELRRRAGPENLILTGDDKKAYDYNQKVRAFNAAQTDIPPEARGQARVLNDYRIMLGRHALALDTRLYRCAQKHSDWMQSAGNMTHDEPDPARRTPTLRAGIEGYSSPVSENVAFGFNTPEAVHRGWYTSSGHHRNMVAKRAWVIGVAKSGTYWTQVFGWAKPAL